jgi:hypothetical protein
MFGDHKLQDSITKKLKPLIIEMAPMRLVPQTRMSERFREQQRISELIADAFFERIHPSEILT